MNTEIEELKEEILVLKKRIDVLEKTERRRKITKMISIIIKIILYLAILFAIWRVYDYVTTSIKSIPNIINNGISNIDIGNFDLFGLFK